jgi:hypothetical protein
MSVSETVFIIPDINSGGYDMSNIYFKEHAFRKMNVTNNSETEYTSTHVTYINNSVVMNGLTFLFNKNGKTNLGIIPVDKVISYAICIEAALLKLYSETYRVINKRVLYSINDDILRMGFEENDDTCKKIGLYIVGIWENTLEYGLEYKWLEFTHPL